MDELKKANKINVFAHAQTSGGKPNSSKKAHFDEKQGLKPVGGRPIGATNKRYRLQAQKAKITRLLSKGLTFNQIALQLNAHIYTLKAFLKRNPQLIPEGYQGKRVNTKAKLIGKERVIRQKLLKGVPKTQLAKEMHVSKAALFKKLNQLGLIEKKAAHKINTEQFLELFNAGKTYAEMSAFFNCHMQTVYKKLKELGLKRYKTKKTPIKSQTRLESVFRQNNTPVETHA